MKADCYNTSTNGTFDFNNALYCSWICVKQSFIFTTWTSHMHFLHLYSPPVRGQPKGKSNWPNTDLLLFLFNIFPNVAMQQLYRTCVLLSIRTWQNMNFLPCGRQAGWLSNHSLPVLIVEIISFHVALFVPMHWLPLTWNPCHNVHHEESCSLWMPLFWMSAYRSLPLKSPHFLPLVYWIKISNWR